MESNAEERSLQLVRGAIHEFAITKTDPDKQYHPDYPPGRIPRRNPFDKDGANYCIELENLFYTPGINTLIAVLINRKIENLIFKEEIPPKFQLAGLETGAIPLLMLMQSNWRESICEVPSVFSVMKERKSYYFFKQISGHVNLDKEVPILLVDDIINSGKSLLNTAQIIEAETGKLPYFHAFSVISLTEHKKRDIFYEGMPIHINYLLNKDDLEL